MFKPTFLYGGCYQNPYYQYPIGMLNDTSQQTQNIASMVNVGLQQQQMSLANSILLNDLEHQFNELDRLHMMQRECCYDGSDKIPGKTNCINCGAPLSGRHLCEYCETYNK